MTDLSQHAFPSSAARGPAARGPAARAVGARRHSFLAPYLVALLAGAAGLYVGRAMGGDGSAYDEKLLLLLRFMAAMKLAGVVLAAVLIHWRFGSPIATPPAVAYLAALASMAAATGLIWSLGAIVLGAALFHIGLLAFLVLAWRDDGVRLPQRR